MGTFASVYFQAGAAIWVQKSRGYRPRAAPVSVLELPLVQGTLLDLDLLIQQCQLIVTAYELRTQDVPFTNHNVILLLLPQLLLKSIDMLPTTGLDSYALSHMHGVRCVT